MGMTWPQDFGEPVTLTFGFTSGAGTTDPNGCRIRVQTDDGKVMGDLWFSREALVNMLAARAYQRAMWKEPSDG